jgi:hypothetical protein
LKKKVLGFLFQKHARPIKNFLRTPFCVAKTVRNKGELTSSKFSENIVY